MRVGPAGLRISTAFACTGGKMGVERPAEQDPRRSRTAQDPDAAREAAETLVAVPGPWP